MKHENVWFRILDKPSTVHTADASRVTGISLERITKSLVFKADDQPILGVIAGDKRIDIAKLAQAVDARKIELVAFEEAESYSGYPPGGTAPVYHANIKKVVFDKDLTRFDTIYGGGGSRDKLIELKVHDILRLSQAIVADITRR